MRFHLRFACLLAVAPPVLAQEPAATEAPSADAPCFRARPRPACTAFFVTNAGGYFTLVRPSTFGGTHWGAAADWGIMFNVSPRDAIGISVFATVNDNTSAIGPQVTYRRWLRAPMSLDLAVATPVAGDARPGSLYGKVRWSPVQWFGVTARPEYLRASQYLCDPSYTNCSYQTNTHGRFSVGVEFGWVPGFVLTLSSGVAVLTLAALFAGSN